MNILMIDTSQSHLLLGVKKGDISHEKIFPHVNLLSTLLASEVITLLKEMDLEPADLNQIRVGAGPGSYTGTRVGVAFAESLGYGLGIPVIKLPSLIFFLDTHQTQLHLKSKFQTASMIEKEGSFLRYQEIDLSKQRLDPSTEFFPKNALFAPKWDLISSIQVEPPLKTLLYFSLL